MRQRLAGHQVGCQFSDARGTKLDHHVREVIGQGFDHLLHAFFAPSGERPQDRTTDKDSSSSHRDCRGNMHPRSNAAIGVDLSLTVDRDDDLGQRASARDRRTTAATMGGHDEPCRSGVDTTACIVGSKHPFHDHRKSAHGAQPVDRLEVDRRIAAKPGGSRSGLLVGSQVTGAGLSGQYRGFTLGGSPAAMSTVSSNARAPCSTARATNLSVRA